jgi:hypothetical protein
MRQKWPQTPWQWKCLQSFLWCLTIGVYPPNTKGAKTKARELLQNNRANYIAKADYSNGSEIDQIVKSILDQISLKASVKQYTE